MSAAAISHMERTLTRLHGWQGWTDKDRARIRDMEAQMRLLGRQYTVREKKLRGELA